MFLHCKKICQTKSKDIIFPFFFVEQGLYKPDIDFTCFDGSKSIPFSSVNDDYCDCVDGSDEPGTYGY